MSNVSMTGAIPDGPKFYVRFRIGGVSGDDQHLEWIKGSLAIGDVVEIRIVDAIECDPPAKTEPVTDDQRERLRIASERKSNG